MARFDVIFAQRYFDALNAYFHPRDYQAPSHVWQWSFDGHEHDAPILLQHMLTAVNSHVNLDLGIAAMLAAEGNLASLEDDFDRINGFPTPGYRSPGVQIPDARALGLRVSKFRITDSQIPGTG